MKSVSNQFHRTAAIWSAILETIGRRKPNSVLVQAIDVSDACMKFEQNLLKMNKVIVCQRNRQINRVRQMHRDRAKTLGLCQLKLAGP